MSLALHVAMVVALFADAPKLDAKKPNPLNEQMQGGWIVEKSLVGGMPAKAGKLNAAANVKGATITIQWPDQVAEITFKLDDAKKPNTIDSFTGKNDGPILGIIQIKGDVMTICYRIDGPRPTEFQSTADNNARLIEFRRRAK